MEKEHLVSFTKPDNLDGIYFEAKLSNGKTIFQDKRENEPHAWVRLSQFIRSNPQLKIESYKVMKRNGKIFNLPDNQMGYVFGLKKTKVYLAPGGELDLVCFGHYDGKFCHMIWINNNAKEVLREKRTKESAGFFLIENN